MKRILLIPFLILLVRLLSAQDVDSDYSPKSESPRIDWTGWVDMKSALSWMKADSAVYGIQFYNDTNISGTLLSAVLGLYLYGDFSTKDMGVHIKLYSQYCYPTNSSAVLYELFGNVNLPWNITLQGGKIIYKWGKGYAFNPVGYANPLKNPENPDAIQEGLLSLNFEAVKTFENPLFQTAALNILVFPAGLTNSINGQYWDAQDTEAAAKAYFQIFSMDLDIMGYYRREGARYLGADLSFNLLTSLEVHGEYSYGSQLEKAFVLNNALVKETNDGWSCLAGFQYAAGNNITVIAEYYHNGSGMSVDEYTNYSQFLDYSAGRPLLIMQAQNILMQFRMPVLMRDYLYVKISSIEPFGILYLTVSPSLLLNLNDYSFTVGPQISYKPYSNTEFILTVSVYKGGSNTEFGDKIYGTTAEIRGKFYF